MSGYSFTGVPRSVINAAIAEMPGWRDLGNRILSEAKNECPKSGNDSGGPHLADSLTARFIPGEDPRILIGTPSQGEKLGFVVNGTDPHPIDPVAANVLSWVSGGQAFFAAHVDHPGTAPNNFILRAAQAVVQQK